MAPGFGSRSSSSPPDGDAQGADAEPDTAFLLYVSEFLHDSAAAPSDVSPAPNDATISNSTASNVSNSSNDSGSGGRAGAGDASKLARQRALAAKRRRAYRERSGAELHALRQQAAALSEQLEALTNHKAAEVSGTIPSCTTALAISRASSSSTDSVWRELAFRQREGRLAAERLRRRLKTQVATRQAFIRGIASSLSRHAVSTSNSDMHSNTGERLIDTGCNESGLVLGPGGGGVTSPAPQPSLSRIELADASLFETYLDELDAAYAQTDEVLRESGLSSQPDETRHQRITRKENEDDDEGYVEIVDSLVVPFRFESIRAIMWDAVVRVHARADREAYASVRDPTNTIAVKFVLQCRPRDGDYEVASGVPLVIILVLRRYVECTREVLVWRAFSEGMGAVEGLSSDETGWSVAREAAMTHDSPFGTDATINQTVVRFQTIRMHSMDSSSSGAIGTAATCTGKILASPPDEDLFAKLIASSADEDGEQISRFMERLMLSGAGDISQVQSM